MNLFEAVISGVIALWLGSTEYRMRKMREDLIEKADRKEVSELIDLKQEALKVSHEDIKEDIREVKDKIDMLIEIQLDNK